ncbi:MAG: sulfide/dihydroorotate dehydrogenase-like FAD/NAD-binding protein [Spirochaetales bacterium]|nr:sulfide/dihydroorotate dehydrogenase-like FAD/NAD-binding protein [Spirochaetales bacterium]
MFEIISREIFSDSTKLIIVAAPDIARKAEAGQFVIVRISEEGERIPLTIADYDRDSGTITLVFQEVGKTTIHLGTLKAGEKLVSVTGPLGCASEIRNYGKVICVGGGVGIAPLFPIARELKAAGNYLISIIGARNKSLLFWEDRMRDISDEIIVCTDDGSYGQKGVVTIPLKEKLENGNGTIKRVWAIGPPIMMKYCAATTHEFDTPTVVSLNSIMVDGTGMCGACRIDIGGKTMFSCVDGPEFDGHEVDWNLVLSRQNIYLEEEKEAVGHYCGKKGCKGLGR